MKLYTKTGDDGETGLFGGVRVAKSDLRVDLYGTVDEMNAVLGVARATCGSALQTKIEQLQNELFVLGAELATAPGKIAKLRLPLLQEADISRLESWIDELDEQLPKLTTFILPGGSIGAAHLHQARAVCRRAERKFIGAREVHELRGDLAVYLNRLSDLLFVMARFENLQTSSGDIPWTRD